MAGFFIALNFVGIVSMIITGVAWLGVGLGRKRVIDKITEEKRDSSLNEANLLRNRMKKRPQVSVVLACKGVHSHSLDNWATQLCTEYDGCVEYLFVVEHEEDEAYGNIKRLLSNDKYKNHLTKLLVAGISWHNSQKIHNVLEGIANSSEKSRYILILDDDIQLHPTTIESLVNALEQDPKVFVAGGHSVDLPHPDSHGKLVEYMLMFFRMINLAGFCTTRPHFIWGACMMLRRDDFMTNLYDIVDVWTDGGHSEDMLTTGLAMQNGRTLAVPLDAILLEYLPSNVTFTSYKDFVHRQLFVNDTYASGYHRRKHNSLLFLMLYSSLLVVAPFFSSLGQLAVWLYHTMTISAVSALKLATTGFCLPATLSMLGLIGSSFVTILIISAHMLRTLTQLCHVMSPHKKQAKMPKLQWLKFYAAFYAHTLIMSYTAWKVFVFDSIVWSGTTYFKKNGRIAKMVRADKEGKPHTISPQHSLDRTIKHYKGLNFPSEH